MGLLFYKNKSIWSQIVARKTKEEQAKSIEQLNHKLPQNGFPPVKPYTVVNQIKANIMGHPILASPGEVINLDEFEHSILKGYVK